MKQVLIAFLLLPILATAQTSKQDSIWKPIKYFIGEWTGTGDGETGKGNYERSYKFILKNRFIEIKNKSMYQPTDKNPKGQVHEDIGYISYDGGKKKFILRQFHIEGFVNEYVLESISPDRKVIVFVTESIENIPAGYSARETYRLTSDNEFEETFEIAEPGKEYILYSIVKLNRK